MGPDGAVPPSPDQDLLGEIKVENLIDNVQYEYDGDTIRVSGDLKNLKDPWEDFDSSNNTGHFIPLKLPESLADKDVKFIGKAQEADLHIDEDRLLVVRLENLTGLTAEIKLDGNTVCKFDFTPLVPVGEEAHDAEKTNFGRYGSMELLTEGLKIAWDGAKGKATGKLKYYHTGTGAEMLKKEGHYFPLSLSEWYDEVPKEAYIKNKKTVDDKDIVFFVEDTSTPITVAYQGKAVMDIDLSGVTLEL